MIESLQLHAANDTAELLATLTELYHTLPNHLRHASQTLAELELPLAFLPQEAGPDPQPIRTGVSSRPKLRHDFYTGELFVERQSDFLLRASDMGGAKAIRCIECERFELDFDGITVDESPETRHKFYLQCYGCSDFSVQHLHARNGRNLALFEDCTGFRVNDSECRNYEGYGLIILHSRRFEIHRCRFAQNLASGIMIIGDCRDGSIDHCEFVESRGYYNWDAGLHLCHCSRRIVAAQVPELCHEPLPIRMKTMRPRRIHISGNLFAKNRAQGVYLEGARECLIENNTIFENNKEGICLDWGTSLCIVRNNSIHDNGYRGNISSEEISIDFIQEFPVLPDQSSSCKLPGVSFDNGILNAIVDNEVRDNYGGGVKMVRAAIGNLIRRNRFSRNGRGVNFFITRVPEVYLLSLANCSGEFDHDREENLDFLSSSFNRIESNLFTSSETDAVHFSQEFNTISGNLFGWDPEGELPSEFSDSVPPATNLIRDQEPPSSPDVPKPETEHILYAFGNATDRTHALVLLNGDGSIMFAPHTNESFWQWDGPQLVFFDSSFAVSTRFSPFVDSSGESIYVGRFKKSDVVHYLIPIVRVRSDSHSSNLPAVLINGEPAVNLEPFGIFFRQLGWQPAILSGFAGTLESQLQMPLQPRAEDGSRSTSITLGKIASALPRGSMIQGRFPWNPDHQRFTRSLFWVQIVRNLRDSLVAHFLAADHDNGVQSPGSSPVWTRLDDPKERFLGFLLGNPSLIESMRSWAAAGAPSSDRATWKVEELAAGRIPKAIESRLSEFGLVKSAIEDAASAQITSHDSEPGAREALWSPGAEALFDAWGLREQNQRLGYDR